MSSAIPPLLYSGRNVLPAMRGLSAAYTYSWPKEIDEVLPESYKKNCIEFLTTKPRPIHYKEEEGEFKWQDDKVVPVQNIEIKVIYPYECNKGLWGGEGIVQGFSKGEKRFDLRKPRVWAPSLTKKPLYSEILDKWMGIVTTKTTQRLINEHKGFDYYILETKERHLNSQLAMKIKRELLLALATESMHPDDPEKKEKVLRRYKKYAIPYEEAQWVGLTVEEVLEILRERHEKENPIIPTKETLTQDYLKYLSIIRP